MIRAWHVALAGVAAVLVVVGHHSVRSARDAFNVGVAQRDAGNYVAAVDHFRRSARWRFPGNGYPERALDALAELAAKAEQRGDTRLALLAWQSIAGSVASNRSAFGMPNAERRAEANKHVVALLSADGLSADVSNDLSARLGAPPSAGLLGTLLLLAGLLGWVWSVWRWPSKGNSREGGVAVLKGAHSVVAIVAFAVFVMGMFLV